MSPLEESETNTSLVEKDSGVAYPAQSLTTQHSNKMYQVKPLPAYMGHPPTTPKPGTSIYLSGRSHTMPASNALPTTPQTVPARPHHYVTAGPQMTSPSAHSASSTRRHRKTNSLVGFDPLLEGDAGLAPPLYNAASKPNATHTSSQTFCMADLQRIVQQAYREENSAMKSPQSPDNQKLSPKSAGGVRKGLLASLTLSPKRSKSPMRPSSKSPVPTDKSGKPRKSITQKLMSKVSKGHRRTKSMETPYEVTSSDAADPNGEIRTSRSNDSLGMTSAAAVVTMPESKRSSADSSDMMSDLMELKFDQLQLPTLSKPAPTSFLTGKEGEVMRTCEHEAAPFQMEIPSPDELVVAGRLNEFVDNYRRMDQNFDLQDWAGLGKMELKQISVEEHIPIAQQLIECGDDAQVRGVVSEGTNCDNRVEAAIFEGQRNFTVVMRGSTEQQAKPASKKTGTTRNSVPIGPDLKPTEVYEVFLDEYKKIEAKCFDLLDKLTEAEPFCDVVFTGYSFGGALATLAAVRYANARPTMRVKCYPMASPKVGLADFRQMVNSSPNLRVVRLEYGQDSKCQFPNQQGGSHVGHTLVLNPSLGASSTSINKVKDPVLAYKFEAPKLKTFKTIYPDLQSYVASLEEIIRLDLEWTKDFVGTSGSGVVVGDENRLVV